jgi:hypothetical protein
MSDDLVANFIAFTGSGPEEAKQYLEMAGGNLEQAVNLFVDMGGGGGGGGAPAASPPVARPSPPPPAAAGPGSMEGVTGDADVAAEVAAVAAAAGIDLPDATMGDGGAEEVRAPIAAYQDQIINPDAERKRMQETIKADADAMQRRMSFDRPVDAPGAGAGDDKKEGAAPSGEAINKLFEPPSFNKKEPYYEVQEKAKVENKWILVNIQQAEVFASHMLNRDVWRDETIQDIVTGSFLFWQRDDKSTEGVQFCQYYNCGHVLPHICVIDPRTGRRVKSWDGKKWAESHAAAEYLFAFLDQNSMSKSPQMSPMESPQGSPGLGPQAAPLPPSDIAMTGVDDPAPAMDTSGMVEDPAAAAAAAPPAEPVAEMPAEPEEGAEAVKVSLRLPSGQRVMRRFRPDAPVSEMFAVASAASSTPMSRVELALQFPTRSLREIEGGLESLIKDAQVAGSQVMVTVKPA